ncbi:hypothetical protein ABB37_05708 [Leptomonas pyrrhocoris]|uniref:Uncharacterized protein n=1 Tax=Leptomonas pyrrhocoris TaxID=157538 RepID=A0A0M9FZE4_LEPPY|nr:hypothetical protein ABB37_05708 [Leptomonas pyrrhocoris]KPA79225.1 hypothetical protein ABB37_05708 [Leptomonas pyrrhocoris]|eukprot:XP_015657664.1 hypothetical protein ABB37_05708 [Leptomonas pyrrhocoris]
MHNTKIMFGSRLEAALAGPELTPEAAAVMRTNKARAQAAQFLMQDGDSTAPLPPLDPSQRTSLHRQLRSRYNPSQIPFSSLSCSKYITANDVEQLARVFHQFNLFAVSVPAVETAAPSRSRRSSPIGTMMGGRDATAATPSTEREANGAAARSPSMAAPETRASNARSTSSSVSSLAALLSQRRTSAIPPPVRNWRVGECVFQGDGMALLRDVVEPPPPPRVTESVRLSLQMDGGARSRSPQPDGTPLPPPAPSTPASTAGAALLAPPTRVAAVAASYTNKAATNTATAAAAAIADGRDLAEPFTSESNDCAMTMDWLVEVLLEMILANYDAANRKGPHVNASDADVESIERRLASTMAGGPFQHLASTQPPVGDYGATFGTAMNNLSAASYQARCRESNMDLLLSVKAELLDWVEQLKQTCDQREHLAAWQNCMLQEDVLHRYQLCVVHSLRTTATATAFTSSHATPQSHASAVSPSTCLRSPLHSLEVDVTSPALTDGGASAFSPSTTPSGAPPRSRRANVRWRMSGSIANASAATAAAPTVPNTRPSSGSGVGRVAVAPSPHALRGLTGPVAFRHDTSRLSRDGAGLVEVLGGYYLPDKPGEELIPLHGCSSTESYCADTAASLPGCAETTASSNAATLVVESSYLTVKARMCAPAFKDLLLCPMELNKFLWESPAAIEIAMEEELKVQQQQHARSTRTATAATAAAASSSVGVVNESFNQFSGDSSSRSAPQSQSQHQQNRRRRAAAEQHLVCWSDVASNLLMGLETTWTTQHHDRPYVRVQTALLEDMAEEARGAAPGPHHVPLTSRRLSLTAVAAAAAAGVGGGGTPNTAGQPNEPEEDEDDDSADESQSLPLGAAGKGGQCQRRRLNKPGSSTDAATLQQRAMLLSSLGAAAEAALRTLHAQAADHVVVSPQQKFIVTSSKDGMLKVWETSRGQFVHTILNVGQTWVLHMCFLHGGEYLLVATSSAEITVINFPAGGVVMKLRGCTSLATAITFVKQPSTVNTQRFGLKPGDCGHHKPVTKQGTSVTEYHAAAAMRLEKQVESESVPIAARPLIGYVAPTAAFYEEEVGHFFFGTLSGMVGCVDLSEPLSRSGLLAAAAGARWREPLHVYNSVYAHPDLAAEREGSPAPPAATASARGSLVRARSIVGGAQPTMAPTSGTTQPGLRVNGVFHCGVGHCVISADCAGGIVRTPFTAAADTLVYSLGAPATVMDTEKPIRFMVCCPGGRRFVTVHSDRRALLWGVGRTTTEVVHQYPQEACDIVDVCFLTHLLQVALLMADRSIHIFDERGTRSTSSIQLPRGLSSRVEDIASVTLKYSANDGEGCLAYLPSAQRIVCGLRGPVLYEPAVRSAATERGMSAATPMAFRTAEEAKPRRGSGIMGTSDTLIGGGGGSASRRDSAALTFLLTASAPASPAKSPSNKNLWTDSSASSPSAAAAATAAADRRTARDRRASISSMTSCVSESSVMDDRAHEMAQRRQRRQLFSAAFLRAEQRLLPYQTHTSAVVGVVLNVEGGELHTISTDTWTTWNFETGLRVRAAVQVPDAAVRELALQRRACRLTCCAWSSTAHTRLLLGTRGSRVLTLDSTVGSVVSVTESLQQGGHKALEDKDVGVIACCGTRTLLCSGRVCEVRRYELTGAPLPSGEERFVSMQVHLPSSTAALSAGGAELTGPASEGKGRESRDRGGSSSPASCAHPSNGGAGPSSTEPMSGANTVTTTITSCCVVRESYLCLGTSDTQLFFYRMVANSSPIQVEVLRDTTGEPDVGRVIGLYYVHNKTQDLLLAVVDTGALYVYSYTLQRMITRYSFPCLGTNLMRIPTSAERRGRPAPLQPQRPHYLTSVSLTDDATSSKGPAAATAPSSTGISTVSGTSQRQLILCCGDSAGYVHVVSLKGVFMDAAAAAVAGLGSKLATKNRAVHIVASFRAATSGVSALETMKWNQMSAPGVAAAAVQPDGSPTRSPDSPSSTDASTSLVLFAGSFDGNVRVFCLLLPPSNSITAAPHRSSSGTSRVTAASHGSPSPLLSFSVAAVQKAGAFTPAAGVALAPPLTGPLGMAPILRGPRALGDGTPYSATILSSDLKSEGTNYNVKDSSGGNGGPFTPVPSSSLTSHQAMWLVNTLPQLAADSSNSAKRSNTPTTNSGVVSRPVPMTVGLCGADTWDLYELNTFSDVKQALWAADFVEEQYDEEGEGAEEKTRLPSIMDDKNESRPKEGETPTRAAAADSAKKDKTGVTAAGAGGGYPGADPREGSAVLLRDVLRRSKKRLATHGVVAASTSVGGTADVASAPAAVAVARRKSNTEATAATRDEAALRSTPMHNAYEKVFAGTAPAVTPGKARRGKKLATLTATSRLPSAPSSHASPAVSGAGSHVGEAALLFKPHTLDELVSGAHPSTSKKSTFPPVKTQLTASGIAAAAAASTPSLSEEGDFGLSSTTAIAPNDTAALNSSLGPQRRPFPFKTQQNPLLHTYPVALLRQMGVMPPQAEPPDVDPVTQKPVELSAQEAFQRWGRTTSAPTNPLLSSTGEMHLLPVATAHLPTSANADPLAPPSGPLSDARGSDETVAGTERTSASSSATSSCYFHYNNAVAAAAAAVGGGDRDAEDADGSRRYVESVSHLLSSLRGGCQTVEKRDSGSTERETAAPDTDDGDDSSGGADNALEEESVDEGGEEAAEEPDLLSPSSSAEEEGDKAKASTFLTEGAAHGQPVARHPRFTIVPSTPMSVTSTITRRSTATTAPTATATLTSAGEAGIPATKLGKKSQQSPCAISVSATDALQSSVFNVSPMTEEANERWIAAQQAQSPFGAPSEALRPRRSRASYINTDAGGASMTDPPPTASSPKHSRAQRERTLLRGALQDLDPQVLKIREEQMMLCHAAGQIDRELRRPMGAASSARRSRSSMGCTQQPGAASAQSYDASSGSSNTVNSSTRRMGVGEFTARLLRVWRQRSGDTAVEASAALMQQLQRPPSSSSHADEATNASMSRRSFADSLVLPKRHSNRGQLPGIASHDSGRLPPNVMMALAAARQATPGAGFGLDLLILTVPCEPPQLTRRRPVRANTNPSLLAASAAGPPPPSFVTPARSARSLPRLGVQQELHPVQVALPCTLQKDESERLRLRRFEAAVNTRSGKGRR